MGIAAWALVVSIIAAVTTLAGSWWNYEMWRRNGPGVKVKLVLCLQDGEGKVVSGKPEDIVRRGRIMHAQGFKRMLVGVQVLSKGRTNGARIESWSLRLRKGGMSIEPQLDSVIGPRLPAFLEPGQKEIFALGMVQVSEMARRMAHVTGEAPVLEGAVTLTTSETPIVAKGYVDVDSVPGAASWRLED